MVRRLHHQMAREGWQQPQQLLHDGSFPLVMRPAQLHEQRLSVAQALRDHAGVPVRAFALVAILENGQERLVASNSELRIDPRPIWNELRQEVASRDGTRMPQEGVWTVNALSSTTLMNERRLRRLQRRGDIRDSDDESSSRSPKKRSKTSPFGRRSSNGGPSTSITSTPTKALRIGDTSEVERYYVSRFKDLQQTACKTIGKVLVKLVEPRKQTHHPYTRGDSKSPPWWPIPAGPDAIRVRHKEPDHLLKHERVALCVWILRLVVQPNHKQHDSIRHLGLNVKKLEESTTEKLNEFFKDKAHPKNAEKRKFLKELFRIAKKEEQYLDGGLDADTMCNVMHGADAPADYESSEDEGDPRDDDDDQVGGKPSRLPIHTPSSEFTSPQTMHAEPRQEPATGQMFEGHDRPSQSMVYAPQPTPTEQHFGGSPVFGRGINMTFQNSMSDDHDRRNFGPPGYPQPQSPYAWTPSTANMVSTPTVVGPYFNTSPALPIPTTSLYLQGHIPSMLPHPPLLPPLQGHQVYDSQPRYDLNTTPGHSARTGGLLHNPITPSSSFGEYHDMDSYSQPNSELREPHLHSAQN